MSYFFLGGGFEVLRFACDKSDPATVFWSLVDDLPASSFPAFDAGTFPVTIACSPVGHKTPTTQHATEQ